MSTNAALIPIYTQWANRHLSKVNQKPINDITNDLRDYRTILNILRAVVPDTNESSIGFHHNLLSVTNNIEGLSTCLQYLNSIGVNCSKVTATDLDAGQLGAVLQLLFALSNYKQQTRQLRKQEKEQTLPVMPPSVAVSKLPSLHQSRATTASTTTTSKMLTPSKISSIPKGVVAPPRAAPPSPAPTSKLSSLRPPTNSSSSGLRSPSRLPSNNNGSVTSSIRGSLSSLESPKTIPKPSTVVVKKATTSSLPTQSSQLNKIVPKATAEKESKMLKLKLFGGGNKDKKEKLDNTTVSKTPLPQQNGKSKLPAAPTSRLTRLAPPTTTTTVRKQTTQQVTLRQKQPVISVIDNNDSNVDKRTSKSSEEDSAYAGFGSTSPASSTQSSISLRSASSKDSREMICEQKEKETDNKKDNMETTKPTMAVKALRVSTSRLTKPSTISKEMKSTSHKKPSPNEEKPTSPTVGVVSPMQFRKSIPSTSNKPETTKISEPSTSVEEKVKPPVPTRSTTSKLQTTFDSEVTSVEIPSMPPVRQPPSYAQLLTEGRILPSRVDSSTSEDSLDSISTTVRVIPPSSGFRSAGSTMNRKTTSTSNQPIVVDPSGYASEGGLGMYERMQARLRQVREGVRRNFDYGDSLEDSSSLSSGISDNFDDVSTDDLSGPDLAMATATYGKPSDYQHFSRSFNARGPRSSSSSMETRSRRVAEQENLHQLLQQCRTSQRGAAAGCNTTLRSPGYGTIGFSRPVDCDSLSLHSRSSNAREPRSSAGFHSLDRKSQMAELYENHHSWTDRNTMAALVSPRRTVQSKQDSQRHSVTVGSLHSSMSRSMVMLQSNSPASSPAQSRRRTSPRGPRNRLPLSVASPVHNGSLSGRSRTDNGYGTYRDPMQLHRLTDEIQRSPSHASKDPMGSHLSLASSSAYSIDKYEAELRKMSNELDGYRQTVSKLTRKHDDYTHLMEVFDQRLRNLSRHLDKSNPKSEDLARLRQEIDQIRDLSGRVAQSTDAKKTLEGAGELLRQPSLESVASMASHMSSMSSSSKSSKTDKTSLSSFGKTKKSWTNGMEGQIRSSFTKAFSKKKVKSGEEGSPLHLNTINGSTSKLDDIDLDKLKRQLESRDEALAEVHLDALDKAVEVDELRQTVNRLKNENKQLKQDMSRLLSTRSRASSQVSLSMLNEDEPLYEVPPATCSSSGSGSSKRSSGCNSVKVTVNVDLKGTITTAICPDIEIIIGFLSMPSKHTTWQELDQQIYALFDIYIGRVDPDRLLGLHCTDSVIGYQIGTVVREKAAEVPSSPPIDVISPTTTIRMFLRGATQESVDSLVLECLFPRCMLEQLVDYLFSHRRLVLSGATGIGKSNLARQLAAYLSVRIGLSQDAVQEIKIPDEGKDVVDVEKRLESLIKGNQKTVVLLDNIPRHRIAFVSSVFSNSELDQGPFVICTVNRAIQLPEIVAGEKCFKVFLLTNKMEGVKGFMARFLRRRIIENEFRSSRQSNQELLHVIHFLPIVLQAVNDFIEKANSLDVTVGPRIFLQCPLEVDDSRRWFTHLWNENIVPYMAKVAKEGIKILGRCAHLDDPTDIVCDHWPWMNGPSPDQTLRRLPKDIAQEVKQPFNPLDTLIRLHASQNSAMDHI